MLVVRQLCGNGNWDFVYSTSLDTTGGKLYCWDKSVFQADECMYEQRFIIVKGRWASLRGPEGLICVYAPNDLQGRKDLFTKLTYFIGQWDY